MKPNLILLSMLVWCLIVMLMVKAQTSQPLFSMTPGKTWPMAVTFGSPPLKRSNHVQFLNPSSVFTSNNRLCQHLSFGRQAITLGSTGFTLTLTFAFTGSAKSNEVIVDFGNDNSLGSMILQRAGSTSNLMLSIFPPAGGSPWSVNTSQIFLQNTAYNLAIVINNVTNQIQIIVGEGMSQNISTSGFVDRIAKNAFIGRSNIGSASCFNGMIFSFNVWNRVLSNTNLQSVFMNLGSLTLTPQIAPDQTVQLVPGAIVPNYISTASYPQFGNRFIRFQNPSVISSSASCQFLDFGSQPFFLLSKGFTAVVTFRFTGSAQNWERIYEFGVGGNPVLSSARVALNNYLDVYFANNAFQTNLNSALLLSQNTIYNIATVFEPKSSSLGLYSIWVNGVKMASVSISCSPLDQTTTGIYFGRSWYPTDVCSNIDIFSFKSFNRILNASEIGAELLNTNTPIISINRNETSDFVSSTASPVINSRGVIFQSTSYENCSHMNFGSQMMSLASDGFSASIIFEGKNSTANPTGWACVKIGASITAARLNSQGIVDCMSTDGASCFWTADIAACLTWVASPPGNLLSLPCSATYRDDPNHWCGTGKFVLESEVIFDIGDATGANRIFASRVRRTNEIIFGYTIDWTTESITMKLPNPNRNHLGVMYDRSLNQLSLWINGSMVLSKSVTTAGVNAFYPNSIAGRSVAGMGQCFDGVIYSLKIFDRRLSASEMMIASILDPCPPGMGFNEPTNECTECPNGQFKPESGNLPCKTCIIGGICNATSFVSCMPGYEASVNSQNCSMCAQGFFQDTFGLDSCKKCPLKATCSLERITSCDPGFQLNVTDKSCQPCKAGFFKSETGLQNCTTCPTSSSCNSTLLISCESGYQLSLDKLSCVPCIEAYFKPNPGLGICQPCPPASICNGTSIIQCDRGYEMTSYGCLNCSYGFFQPFIGNSPCIPCPLGAVCNATTATCSSGLPPRVSGKNFICESFISTSDRVTPTQKPEVSRTSLTVTPTQTPTAPNPSPNQQNWWVAIGAPVGLFILALLFIILFLMAFLVGYIFCHGHHSSRNTPQSSYIDGKSINVRPRRVSETRTLRSRSVLTHSSRQTIRSNRSSISAQPRNQVR